MKFNESPSNQQLQELQALLDKNPEPGIADIWVTVCPRYLTIEDNGKAVGVASMICLGDEAWELHKLYVARDYRTKGSGAALVQRVIEIAREQGVGELFIEISGDSFPFWQRMAESWKFNEYGGNKYSIQVPSP